MKAQSPGKTQPARTKDDPKASTLSGTATPTLGATAASSTGGSTVSSLPAGTRAVQQVLFLECLVHDNSRFLILTKKREFLSFNQWQTWQITPRT